MSIASEITRLQNDKTAIANAIAATGVPVPQGSGYDDFAALISKADKDPDWIKDGDTHLWLNISTQDQKNQELRIRMKGTIDWGDGTTEGISVTTYTTFTHTYANLGKYRIDLKPTTGTFYLGSSSAYCTMGLLAGRIHIISSLYQVEIGTKEMNYLLGNAFNNVKGLKRVYIPKTITTIGSAIFANCTGLEYVEFEDSTTITSTTISTLFQLCPKLWKCIGFAPTNVTSFGPNVYYYCQTMEEVTIPVNIASLGASSLYLLSNLKDLWCLPTAPPTVANANTFTNFPSTAAIKVPFGSLSAYQAAENWSTYASQMVEAGRVTMTLTNVNSSNRTLMVNANSSYTTTLTADEGYTLGTVTVTMGGTDITSTACSNGEVSIASVTGNITITATATENS